MIHSIAKVVNVTLEMNLDEYRKLVALAEFGLRAYPDTDGQMRIYVDILRDIQEQALL